MGKEVLISVILAVFNEETHIQKTLDGILAQDLSKDKYEIIIADGGSTDKTVQIVNKYMETYKNISLLHNLRKISAAGWNDCMKIAKGEIVSLLSGHVLLEKDYLSKVLNLLTPDITGVGGAVTPIGGNKFSKHVSKAYKTKFGSGNANYIVGDSHIENVETIGFGNYWKKDLLAIDGFDETLKRGQDWDLNVRLRKNGGILVFDPSIKINFYVRSTMMTLWKRHYNAGYWKIDIIKKNPDSILPRHIVPALFSLLFLALPLLSLFSDFTKIIYALFLFTYFGASLTFSILLKNIEKKNIGLLMAIFLNIHLSYGVGIILRLLKFWKLK